MNATTERLDGAAILDRLHATITRYVILPSAAAVDAVVLWIAATHVQQAWAHAPRLVIRAPEKRCGKSRLLDVVEGTCHNPLISVNLSTAAVYRSIGSDNPPTLLIDEADTIFGGENAKANEDLRGLLNAGHQRNRPTIRWDINTRTLEEIPTFAMAALAGIGMMPDTIEDRAVVIRMRRRAPGETVAPYRIRRDGPALRKLAADLVEWLTPHAAELERAEPVMPLEDRAADTWEPLIAVADLAGGDWPDRGRRAAEILNAERDGSTVASDRVRLLTDCRAAFGNHDAIPTSVLLERLKADPEAPWADYGTTGLTAMKLGVMLREYEIRSANIRFALPYGQAKGYTRSDFQDAWTRYCPPVTAPDVRETSQPSQASPSSPAPGRLALVGRLEPSQGHEHDDIEARPDSPFGTPQAVPPPQAVPHLTCDGTPGTAGTAQPHLFLASGGDA
ncbi:DUF3631 domain-containing protein [Dactylosporangium sp. NPDC000244]|uniref:DUF3631 domain-containing protein n=1 Tax=Dactylosporangium sp. NPDC000244 TaxID=3154365 RepID=UPI003316AD63